MLKIARFERRASELDTREYPESDLFVDWRDFNCSFNSAHRQVTVMTRQMMETYKDELIDLRPYMI